LVFVHLKVALVPVGTPVTSDVGDDGVAIVAVPLTMLHEPVPWVIVLPANVKLLLLQLVWLGPALGTVDAGTFVSTTSSVDTVQGPLETVHLNVALVPDGTPVIPDVLEEGVVMEAVPLTRLHAPVPIVGAVAFMVKLPLLQFVISVPALDVDGFLLKVITTSSVEVQGALVIVHLKV